MPQFFSEYLFPTNLIALGILTFLTTFFFYWLIELIRYWRWLWTERKQIENKQNVQPLVTARQERDRGREDNDQKTNPEYTFSKFCTEGSLDRGSPIAKHLNAIFLAGWDESRLEVGELINHTTSELFKRNSLFRSVLAVFIVIGLFGTLFGLADSLTGLFPALKANVTSETSAENSEGMIQALGILLEGMKGALAPSICGIFFTILGVILYGAYLQFACHPIKAILERLTLTVWVPQLYPTTSQKLAQTLQQSESQMQEGFRTAAQFSESVQKVHSNIDEFNESLAQASAITEPLSDSVKQINKAASDISAATDVLNTGFAENLDKFSEEFSSSVTHLTGFQDEIRELHQQFQKAANEKLDQQIEKSNEHNQNLAQLSNVLTRVPEALKSYETTYINSLEQIDEKLQKFINKATETNTSIYEENREWFEDINDANKQQFVKMQSQLKTEIGDIQQTLKNQLDDLTTRLIKNFKSVQQDLDSGLTTLNEQLENFDTPLTETVEEIKGVFDERLTTLNEQLEKFPEPIQKSADQMRGTFADLVTFMRGIVGDLQQKIKEQNEKYEEQLTGVKSL
ncbi:MAG: MotA/TolQ/ExbB proton channel family protein, partial [Candidatus Poribacteria bacterium]|nr:MotA/TolQ/ExbB proton channel family protein [Candidatus Poribacteria bacterium]